MWNEGRLPRFHEDRRKQQLPNRYEKDSLR
jgi:hypothetical protein